MPDKYRKLKETTQKTHQPLVILIEGTNPANSDARHAFCGSVLHRVERDIAGVDWELLAPDCEDYRGGHVAWNDPPVAVVASAWNVRVDGVNVLDKVRVSGLYCSC